MTMQGLEALARLLPVLREPGFAAGAWRGGGETQSGVLAAPYVASSDVVGRFVAAAHEAKWIKTDFDWSQWALSTEAEQLRTDASALARADPDQLASLLTVLIRQDRFVEGALLSAFESGLVLRIVERASSLLQDGRSGSRG